MQLNLEHDWQGNMSTPRARVGERAKIRLLIILCAVWLFMGLIGHHPWKPFESNAVSTITNVLTHGNLVAPTPASQDYLSNPPLYYLSAALTATAFESVLPLHDGARIATGLWMLLTLIIIGMTGRELWGKGFGRQTAFIFIGSIGLIISAHIITPATSTLTAIAACFYALALAKRRPYRASILLGVGMGVGFLSTGLTPLAISLLSCAALPALYKHWRTSSFAKVVGIAILIASPMILGWISLCMYFEPVLFNTWLTYTASQFNQQNHLYFLNLLLWFAWPSLPLAAWALWRYRTRLLNQAKFQLCITFFAITFLCISVLNENKDIYALPLLIPLTALAGGSIETLKRGAASALNWFGLILFGFMGFLIWLGWSAMMSGNPAKLKERLTFLSGLIELDFNIFAFAIASAITIIWLFSAFRTQHSNRAAATNWAIGMTLVWTLLMTLWLPMIDSARSYGEVFTLMKNALPTQYNCIASKGVGDAQRDLLDYYSKIQTTPIKNEKDITCDLLLVQDGKRPKSVDLDDSWHHVWSGKRISDRKESFRLFQRTPTS